MNRCESLPSDVSFSPLSLGYFVNVGTSDKTYSHAALHAVDILQEMLFISQSLFYKKYLIDILLQLGIEYRHMENLGKAKSLVIVALIYVFALAGGYLLSCLIPVHLLLKLFLADVFATAIVYIFTIIFKNTSVYDPYWSFVPWVIAVIAMIEVRNFSIPIIIILLAFTYWSWRLTLNWISTFKNIKWEDWRYTMYRNKYNRFVFEIINFVGLQMMPTVLVYAGLTPFILLIQNGSNYWSILGAVVIIAGTLLEMFSDHQMHTFLRETTEKKTCQKGLWNYSRHPNYLGEITIWFGPAIVHLIQYPTQWYFDVGCILMVLLFNFISIPMMEKRQLSRRPDYEMYRKTTSRLLILPKRKIQEKEIEVVK